MATKPSGRTSPAAALDDLQARGQYTTTSAGLATRTGLSGAALEAALRRLRQKRRLVSPRRGFHVIVPVEYRDAGAPPASWFIDDLAKFLKQPYYVGLLTAAALHGAAHQQPMAFQVVTDRPTRAARVGNGIISFHFSRHLASVPTTAIQTETGTMRVSTPAGTAFDLIRFVHASGGLGNASTVLSELADRLDARTLVAVARKRSVPEVQRLGFILERLNRPDLAEPLHDWLAKQRVRNVLLAPGERRGRQRPDARWKVAANAVIEVDL